MIKKLDILVLLLLPVIAVSGSLAWRANYLLSTLLFYGLPAIYLSWRNAHAIRRSIVFSLLFALPTIFITDYVFDINNVWFVSTVFPFRVLGTTPVENFIWGILWIYSIIMFYEHFLDKGKHNVLDKKMKYFVEVMLVMGAIFILVYLNFPQFFRAPFTYFGFGSVLIILPVVLFLGQFPKLVSKYIKVSIYFSLLAFLNELTALQLGHWYFPGREFIGWIQLGDMHFPLEELFFYILLGSTAVLSYFEYLDDGHLKREARRYT